MKKYYLLQSGRNWYFFKCDYWYPEAFPYSFSCISKYGILCSLVTFPYQWRQTTYLRYGTYYWYVCIVLLDSIRFAFSNTHDWMKECRGRKTKRNESIEWLNRKHHHHLTLLSTTMVLLYSTQQASCWEKGRTSRIRIEHSFTTICERTEHKQWVVRISIMNIWSLEGDGGLSFVCTCCVVLCFINRLVRIKQEEVHPSLYPVNRGSEWIVGLPRLQQLETATKYYRFGKEWHHLWGWTSSIVSCTFSVCFLKSFCNTLSLWLLLLPLPFSLFLPFSHSLPPRYRFPATFGYCQIQEHGGSGRHEEKLAPYHWSVGIYCRQSPSPDNSNNNCSAILHTSPYRPGSRLWWRYNWVASRVSYKFLLQWELILVQHTPDTNHGLLVLQLVSGPHRVSSPPHRDCVCLFCCCGVCVSNEQWWKERKYWFVLVTYLLFVDTHTMIIIKHHNSFWIYIPWFFSSIMWELHSIVTFEW